jgi:hypothetical protein
MAGNRSRPGDARHVCRFPGCGYVVEPRTGAHRIMDSHVNARHGHARIGDTCRADCGFRATPSEGRYTKDYTPKGTVVASVRGGDGVWTEVGQ